MKNEKMFWIVTLILVVGIIVGVVFYVQKVDDDNKYHGDQFAFEQGFESRDHLRDLVMDYYWDGKTKSEAIKLLVDRGYSKRTAEEAIERYW